jgi:lysophospholipase L1-like esterase
MRVSAIAAVAALLLCTGLEQRAAAQPVSEGDLRIVWEVRNRFRLFRSEADFQRHVAASQTGSVLTAEQHLARASDGRGWAKDMLARLCVDGTGRLLETCQRDGERENYLVPQDHAVVVRLTGPIPPGANCTWSFDDGTPPPRQATAPCSEEMKLRVRYGAPTIAAAGITRADNSVDSVSAEIRVQDVLIAGLGDSVAAGEGNPDRPVVLDDLGFCFRRFLGSGLSEYFRPSRAGYRGEKACPDSPVAVADDWARHGAAWMSAACHRSLYGYQLRTALGLAVENPHIAVTFIPLACTGATIADGLLGSQRARECPLTGNCASSVPAQIAQLQQTLTTAKRQQADRTLDLVLLTVGANDIKFSGLVADVIITAGVERTLFQQGGLIASVPEAQRILDGSFTSGFGKLRAALKPLVGGDMARVVYVSYGHPGLQGDAPCPGGRDGLDIHPAFDADGARLRLVTDFVQGRFLPKVKALARCEGSGACRDPSDRMTFVDSHQAAFADRGFCARSPDDPPFDRECFSERGESFDPNPVSAATAPLACSLRPSEFRPYAPRARWIRTANDSYFAAMTFPQGLLQPSNIHDATWAAVSAVYGGAIHPSAEGHAAMADAALRAVREVMGLKAPPAVTAAPLPPPADVGGVQAQ